MGFQFFHGPAVPLFNLGGDPLWAKFAWGQLILWLIGGSVGGWLLGTELNRLHFEKSTSKERRTNRWAVASTVTGLLGVGISALYFLRSALPLDFFSGLSPATAAADWLLSWGLFAAAIAIVAIAQALTNPAKRHHQGWAGVGIVFAIAFFYTSVKIVDIPWKAQFNKGYAERLLREHGRPDDPNYAKTIYTGNLILAQSALDISDPAGAGRYLVDASKTTGFPAIAESGPDTSMVRALLEQGEREAVLQYLQRFHELWPAGDATLQRWETTIREGRTPNFGRGGNNAQQGIR